MSATERVKTWQVWLAAIALTATVLGGVWAFLQTEFMPRAEASQAHAELVYRELREVRDRLREQRLYRARVRATPDSEITPQDRADLMAEIDEDIRVLEREEKCLESGNLRCE